MGPKVTLVDAESHKNDIARVYILWHQSRTDEPLFSVFEVNQLINLLDFNIKPEVNDEKREALISAHKRFGHPRDVFRQVVRSNIPVSEAINYIWVFENITVSFREQLVRHRDYRIHQQDSYWSQSSRCRPLDDFFDSNVYDTPLSIDANVKAKEVYDGLMKHVQDSYRQLKSLGIHQDDARNVFPMAMSHRISFHTNLRNLLSMFKERSCWVAQASIWAPIISQMVDQLSSVDTIFREVVEPPCCTKGKFKSCPYVGDNELRIKGLDPAPVCPLYAKEIGHPVDSNLPNFDQIDPMVENYYSKMWPASLLSLIK